MFRIRRGGGAGPHVVARAGLLAAGGGLGVLGMTLNTPALVWAGIAVLVVAFALRFRGGAPEAGTTGHGEDDGEDSATR